MFQTTNQSFIQGTADAGDLAVDQIGHGRGGPDHHAAQARFDGREPGGAESPGKMRKILENHRKIRRKSRKFRG